MATKAHLSAFHRSVVPKQKAMGMRCQKAQSLTTSSIPSTANDCEALLRNVEATMGMLTDSIETFKTHDQEWLEHMSKMTDEDEIDAEEKLYGATAVDENTGYLPVVETCRNYRCELDALSKSLERQISELRIASHPAADASNSSSRTIRAKLPKLTLPVFDGNNALEWAQFWTIFATNIDSQHITKTEKFTYLIGLLRGTALETIKGITICDDNYDSAVSLLRERFERSKGSTVGRLYGELKKLSCSQKSATSIRQTYNVCETILRQLEECGEGLDSNTSLAIDVLSKYPPAVVTDLFQRYGVTDDSNVSAIRKAILKYINDFESLADKMSHLQAITPSEPKRKNDVDNIPINRPTFQAHYSTSSPTRETSAFTVIRNTQLPPTTCYFCDNQHFNCDCPTYPTAADRVAQLRNLNRCLRCGRTGHRIRDCQANLRCFHCQATDHCSSICKQQYPSSQSMTFTATSVSQPSTNDHAKPMVEKPNLPKSQNGSDVTNLLTKGKNSVLCTALTTIVNPITGARQRVRIVLDSGSHRTYITEAACNRLGLSSSDDENLNVVIFATTNTLGITSNIVNFEIVQRDGSIKSITANTTPLIADCSVLPDGLSGPDLSIVEAMKPALAEQLDDKDGRADVLIGNEYFWDFINGAPIHITETLRLIPSTLGLLLGGRYESSSDSTSDAPTFLCITEATRRSPSDVGLITAESRVKLRYPDIDEYWELEKIGITDDPTEDENDKALDRFNETIYFGNGRYNVQWPWIDDKRRLLPTNYELSFGRLKSLVKRFRTEKETDLPAKYQEVIDNQISKGVIEEVPNEYTHDHDGATVHYLPHHPVVKATSNTTKVRIVYDASSKVRRDRLSLNECIYRGPIMLPHLCEVLIRFRLHPIVVIADVEKAFLQVALQPSERDATRFLWLKDPTNLTTDNNLATYRFCRVPFGVIASPFLLAATLQHHLKQYDQNDDRKLSNSARMIAENLYVDNVTCGADHEDNARQLLSQMDILFNEAGMHLQELCSNNETILNEVPENKRIKSRIVKMLGLSWDSSEDTIQIAKKNLESAVTTKRTILHAVASIFDPLGFYQPVTLPAKFLLQELWQRKFDWDREAPDDVKQQWDKLRDQFERIFDHRIPRHIEAANDPQIVTFCDASGKGYATAVYLRSYDSKVQRSTVNLVYSKSRLAPRTKTITLPRLELLGVLIGVRASEFVRTAMKCSGVVPIHVFTDSEVTLHWIRTNRLLGRFVANQVKLIKAVPDTTFHHVKSEENPADYCTRGKPAAELQGCELWWKGPTWLTNPISEWPPTNIEPITPQLTDTFQTEIRSTEVTLLAGRCDTPKKLKFCGIKIDRFSKLTRLMRVSVLVVKFIKLKVWNRISDNKRAKHPVVSRLFDHIDDSIATSARDIQAVKDAWVKAAQQLHYSTVVEAIESEGRHRLIEQLNLRLDEDGLVRSYSRYANTKLTNDTRFPKLLPKDCRLTEMIIEDKHRRVMHAGVAQTLDQVRSEHWIPQGRAVVQRILRKCYTCRKHRGPRFALPRMPDWPKERVIEQPPFACVGLDYFGPISITVGSDRQKAWVCLFTCLITRAIHLEIVADCTSIEFLNCVIRFTARRGMPKLIISDNASQFRTVQRVIDRAWFNVTSDDAVLAFYADHGIQWKFITQLAPWQGGFYERLVKVVKDALKVAIGRRLLSWQEFVTLIAETEAVVNSRPITYVHSDRESAFVTIRPIDFITDLPTCQPNIDSHDVDLTDIGDVGRRVAAYWKYRQRRKRQIWDLWSSEYLLSLRERSNRTHRKRRPEVKSFPATNQVVILQDDDAPRGAWKLAKVIKILPSNDESVRAVELQLPNRMIIRRAINHLYPLEIDTDSDNDDATTSDADNDARAVPEDDDRDVNNDPDVTNDDDFPGFSAEDIRHTLDTLRRYDSTNDESQEDSEVAMFASIPVKQRLSATDVRPQLVIGLAEDPIDC